MSKLFDKLQAKIDDHLHGIKRDADRPGPASDGASLPGSRHGVPGFVIKHVDKYIDAMRPVLVPLLTHEIDRFQTKTIDSLEDHMSEAFKSIFEGKYSTFKSKATVRVKTRDANDIFSSHEEPGVPEDYGQRSTPLLDIPELTEDLNLDFDFDPLQHASPEAKRALAVEEANRNREWAQDRREGDIFSIALQKVSKFAEATQGQMGLGAEVADTDGPPPATYASAPSAAQGATTDKGFDLSDELRDKFRHLKSNFRSIADEVANARNHPEEKARAVAPDLKMQIAEVLRKVHLPLAEQMITIALTQLKLWLRGHISTRELIGDAASSDLHDALSNLSSLFKHKAKIGSSQQQQQSRGIPVDSSTTTERAVADNEDDDEEADELDEVVRQRGPTEEAKVHGVAGVLSRKLSNGLTRVRTETRTDFQRILSTIERSIFDLLPDAIRGPLSKIFGGNPFEADADDKPPTRDLGSKASSFLNELFDVRAKLRALIDTIQLALRRRVLEIIGGGHRLLERLCWAHVQQTVAASVRKYVPKIRIDIEEEEAQADALKHQHQQHQQQQSQGAAPVPLHSGQPPPSASGEAASYWAGDHHGGSAGSRDGAGPAPTSAPAHSQGPQAGAQGSAASYYSGTHH